MKSIKKNKLKIYIDRTFIKQSAKLNNISLAWYGFTVYCRLTATIISMLIGIQSALSSNIEFTFFSAIGYVIVISFIAAYLYMWSSLLFFKRKGIVLYFILSLLIIIANTLLAFNYTVIHYSKILGKVFASLIILSHEFIYYEKRWFLFRENKSKKRLNSKIAFRTIILCVTIIIPITSGIIIYNIAYNKGFDDNKPISDDGSPIVYVTPSGDKYHKKNCSYLNGNEISISLTQANKKGYIACSKCNPTSVSVNSEIKSNNAQASAVQIVDSKNNTGLQNNMSQDTLNYISNLSKKLKERAKIEEEERRQKGKCIKNGCRSTPFDNHDYCTQHRCKISDCENERNTYSDYCSHHCCSWSSCTDYITNKDSIYCETHTCQKDGCNLKVSYNSKYCIKHK